MAQDARSNAPYDRLSARPVVPIALHDLGGFASDLSYSSSPFLVAHHCLQNARHGLESRWALAVPPRAEHRLVSQFLRVARGPQEQATTAHVAPADEGTREE